MEDYLALDDADLLAQCRVDTFRVSGPGGQHRNKNDTAVRLTHLPTGVVAQATEERSQHRNKAAAIGRLREAVAIQVRRPVNLDHYRPPDTLTALLGGKRSQRIGPRHPAYPRGVQDLLDLLTACDGAIGAAAERIGVSTGALSRLILRDGHLTAAVNRLRDANGLHPLR